MLTRSCLLPQVKLSNMMRVLGGEAVADPTALEAQRSVLLRPSASRYSLCQVPGLLPARDAPGALRRPEGTAHYC